MAHHRIFSMQNRTAWLVLVICLLLTWAAWSSMQAQMQQNAQLQFAEQVKVITAAVEERLRKHEQILLGGAGVFDASQKVDRDEWRVYVERLNLKKHYPGIQGVGFSLMIQPEQLPHHIATIRAEGFPDYTVRPAGERTLYSAIIFLEPFLGRNLAAFGFDMYSEPTRQAAMRLAGETGQTTISGKVKLVQETHGKPQAGFLMYVPVYKKNMPLNNASERWQALHGFVYSPYRMGDLMGGILGERQKAATLKIYDDRAESAAALMYDSNEANSYRLGQFTQPQQIHAFGRDWSLRVNSTEQFDSQFDSVLDDFVLAFGLFACVMLFILVSTVSFRRERAEEMAAAMTHDIRENQEVLRRNEARMSAILDHVLDGVISIDERGTVQTFNASAERIFGYQAYEVVGQNVKMLMPEPYQTQHDGYLLNYLQTSDRKIIGIGREVHGRRKDGTIFPMDLGVNELVFGEKRLFTGVVRDISERKHLDEELRKLSRAVEQSPVPIVIANARGEIEYVNGKFSEVTGYARSEMDGRLLQSGLISNEQYRAIWNALEQGKEWRGRLQNCRKNGEMFWEENHISPVFDAEGKVINFVAVKEDISQRVKLERMKSEFISTVSHELRTPLTAIRGALALLCGGAVGSLPESLRPMMDIALKNSERLILLVNDLLDMEKIEAGKMEYSFKLNSLIDMLRLAVESNNSYAAQFQVKYELSDDLPDVVLNIDEHRLLQVLANLLSNAAKFSPKGEVVRIEAYCDGNRVKVKVHNHGDGIPVQFRGQIFQKFMQADSSDTRQKGGTGLGLAISKAMIEQMGGNIGFDSEPGILTTFYIDFPVWLDNMAEAI